MAKEGYEGISEELEALANGMIVMAMCLVMICCLVALTVQDERQANFEKQERIERQLSGKTCESAHQSKGTSTTDSEQAFMQTAQSRSLTKAELP